MKHFLNIIALALCLSTASLSQDILKPDCPDSLLLSLKKESLATLYGTNKEIPENIKIAALYSLSFYPELEKTRIVFKEKKIKTTLNVRPTFFSLIFRKKVNRKYIVRINNSNAYGKVMLEDVPFCGVIGLLGHEFGHIYDYNEKGFFGVIGRGFDYLSKKRRAEFENEIDMITINKGLGKALYYWAYFVLNQSDASDEYKDFKRDVYMSPEEILHVFKE